MKAFKNYLFLYIVILPKWVSIGSYALGQTQTMVSVSPSSMTVQPSFTTAIEVRVNNVENLFAASVTLAFDSTILHYSSVIGGSFLRKNDINSVFLGVVPQPPLPTAPNRVTVDQAIQGGGTVSGSGILFTVLFTALRSGSCPIIIASSDFRNGLNTSIPTQTISGKVIVNQSPLITSSPVLTALTNQSYQYQVQGRDPDGDTLSYSLI
ncbi:MAG: cohesin domain-containing protein, partial [Bacteroidota bacterium]